MEGIATKKLETLQTQVIEWRRYLHANPELSFEEVETPAFIVQKLKEIGFTDIREHVGGRGVVAKLHGKKPGPTIAFRADFDALPIHEENDVSYASTKPGVMHACGHDGHTAALLGVAATLFDQVDELRGTIVFLFQHAEEKPPGGAREMIADGCLEGVDAVFGAHVSSQIPLGQINASPGAVMAAVDAFTVNIQGKGGHGAHPHSTIDSIVIGSQLVNDLQTIVSRRINPMDTAVVTVGVFQAGTAFNVIADTARIEGTVRTFQEETRAFIEEEIRAIVSGKEHGGHVTCTIDYLNGYPPLVNAEKETEFIRDLAKGVFGEGNVLMLPAALGGEDFAYYLEEKPGCFFHVGGRTEEERTQFPHHHPRFDFDERALFHIGEMFLAIANQYLRSH
ncbi:M20 metallopeptidase family protein [Shouchella clausii]|uniref:Peptidase M20 n=1 Tax=Shouchella clausii TaxID=79880 RepID=A0A268RX63_SHOCL|nr:amidohydrolase [Shouchella clausii]PAD41455.1 peptidase M20 [Bacillus sp. 7520-S]AST96933.1 peptidase M20 [Shouchella clausii]MCY1105288.1 amidohydrolase [Shouchella clausii]MEB5474051.1 amidohydrolase [Shouchella clausii]MEB5482324.1 amidohydrolase [Shouchella clausii]